MAVLLGELKGAACASVLETDARLPVSAGTLAEAMVAAVNRGIGSEMAALVGERGVEMLPVTAATAARVAEAYALGAERGPPGRAQPRRLLRLRPSPRAALPAPPRGTGLR
jgi:uncharacterized protein with PIN domain